jgi:hypothetical protein
MKNKTLAVAIVTAMTVSIGWLSLSVLAQEGASSSFSVMEAKDFLDNAAVKAREKAAQMTFEEFKDSVFKEPFEGGKYIVNGDTPISNF